MIVRRTFSDTHFLNFAGRTALDRREKLRREVEEFIANRLNEEDVINITESGASTFPQSRFGIERDSQSDRRRSLTEAERASVGDLA